MYIIFFQSTYQIEKRPPFLYNNTEYMLSSGQFLRHSFDLCIRAIGVYEKLVGGRTLNMAKHRLERGLLICQKMPPPLALLLFTALIEEKNLESY